ncbi:MAG: DUF6036 family nucleotidyltransferase [Deltaproteobacteria bacterium]
MAAFAAHGVDYLLIGGHAVSLHGHARFTKDLDLWIRPTVENLSRARRALVEFGAPDALLRHLDSAAPEDVLWMGAPPLRIDLVKGVPGGDFEAAWRSRLQASWDGVAVSVVGLDDLIALKRASGRPQDLVDADALELARRSGGSSG